MSPLAIGTTAYVDNKLQVRIIGILFNLNSMQYQVSWINNNNDIKTDLVDAYRVTVAAPLAVNNLKVKIG